MKVIIIMMIYTFDEFKQMKEYALQNVEIIQQQTLLNYFKVRNRFQPICEYFFHDLIFTKKNNTF